MFEHVVITDEGRQLIAQATSTNNLIIEGVKCYLSQYDNEELMQKAFESDPVACEGNVSTCSAEGTTARIQVSIEPQENELQIHTVAIYAHTHDDATSKCLMAASSAEYVYIFKQLSNINPVVRLAFYIDINAGTAITTTAGDVEYLTVSDSDQFVSAHIPGNRFEGKNQLIYGHKLFMADMTTFYKDIRIANDDNFYDIISDASGIYIKTNSDEDEEDKDVFWVESQDGLRYFTAGYKDGSSTLRAGRLQAATLTADAISGNIRNVIALSTSLEPAADINIGSSDYAIKKIYSDAVYTSVIASPSNNIYVSGWLIPVGNVDIGTSATAINNIYANKISALTIDCDGGPQINIMKSLMPDSAGGIALGSIYRPFSSAAISTITTETANISSLNISFINGVAWPAQPEGSGANDIPIGTVFLGISQVGAWNTTNIGGTSNSSSGYGIYAAQSVCNDTNADFSNSTTGLINLNVTGKQFKLLNRVKRDALTTNESKFTALMMRIS